jgi:valyl-tRNA synthetase
MSKSLGNSPDPLAIMERYGADAVRFTMVYLTPTGQDLMFDEKRLETGKFFANKVWNATRLVSMRLGDEDLSRIKDSQLALTLADRWILSRYANAVKDVTRNLKTYRLNEAANALYHFIWNDYCDWYLEMVKPRWSDGDGDATLDPHDRLVARWVAWRVLDGSLRMLHPFMPFVTEELWQAIPHDGETIALASWPNARKNWFDAEAEKQIEFLQQLVVAVRNLRAEAGLGPGKRVPLHVRGNESQTALIEKLAPQIRALARVESITVSARRRAPRHGGIRDRRGRRAVPAARGPHQRGGGARAPRTRDREAPRGSREHAPQAAQPGLPQQGTARGGAARAHAAGAARGDAREAEARRGQPARGVGLAPRRSAPAERTPAWLHARAARP